MRAVWISKHGAANVLQVRENPDPEIKPGDVKVRVHAAGLNFAEVMARQGLYPDAPKPPCVVGYEFSGVVEEAGKQADASLVGKRVLGFSRFGGHADVVCVRYELVAELPENMSFEQGAALPVNYLTANHILFRVAPIRPGHRVLIHMAAGGVGHAAIQLCRTVPDVTVFGTASASKHDHLREIGCQYPIDYHTEDYAVEVKRLTDGKGVDRVLDPLGAGDWKKGYELLRPTGMLVAYGMANVSSGRKRSIPHVLKQLVSIPRFSPMSLMSNNRAVAGVNIGNLWDELPMLREEIRSLLTFFVQGKISPQIDRVFSFEEAAEAHRYIESRKNIGKVLLVP